jgi:hypothetical protein
MDYCSYFLSAHLKKRTEKWQSWLERNWCKKEGSSSQKSR